MIELPVVLFPQDGQSETSGQPAWGAASRVEVDLAAAALIEFEMAERHLALPLHAQGRILLVAMANPDDREAVAEISQRTGLRVRPVRAAPEDLLVAIGAAYTEVGRRSPPTVRLPLGQLLVQRRLITADQLEEALRLQQRTGSRLGRILVGLGAVNRLAVGEALAEQLRLPHVNLRLETPAVETVRLLEAEAARRLQCVPVRWVGSQLMVAMADPGDSQAREELTRLLSVPLMFAVTSELDVDWVLDRVYRSTYIEESVAGLLYRNPQESAYETFTDAQIIAGVVLLVFVVLGMVLAPRNVLILANGAAAVFYMGISLYRLWLAYRGGSSNLTIMVSEAEVTALAEADLPVYSVLIALYREKETLPQLIRALDALDYPKSKLDVRLLLEESDRETLEAARALHPPGYITLVIVPDAAPRTKPKALNYGLVGARGQFTVIFDAEDLPDPDQLKRAVAAFRRAPPNVVCLQAKLNYYNRNQNLLTRWFTTEYSSWFDLILPGLDNTRAPIPLGGTSNHFYSEVLRDLGGWDPFNVTEDADLGVRLFRRGYRAGVVDSTTYEEANSDAWNWVRQRSRWVKGYMQTWLVHMRHPLTLLRALGPGGFLSFQLMIGGVPAVFLLNPIYWTITTLWFLTGWGVIPSLFPGSIYYLSAVNLLIGNFVFIYLNLAASFRRGYYELGRYALLTPIYWLMMSLAAWRALWQLVTHPFYWEKTVHGLSAPLRPPGLLDRWRGFLPRGGA